MFRTGDTGITANSAGEMMAGSVRDERELTGPERALLQWLIQNGTGNSAELMAQLAEARVVSRCGCGCPTIDLAVWDTVRAHARRLGDRSRRIRPIPRGLRRRCDLHVREDLLSELEVYANGNVGPFTTPSPSSLKIA